MLWKWDMTEHAGTLYIIETPRKNKFYATWKVTQVCTCKSFNKYQRKRTNQHKELMKLYIYRELHSLSTTSNIKFAPHQERALKSENTHTWTFPMCLWVFRYPCLALFIPARFPTCLWEAIGNWLIQKQWTETPLFCLIRAWQKKEKNRRRKTQSFFHQKKNKPKKTPVMLQWRVSSGNVLVKRSLG